ncbi:MAG: hypothetical protein LBJ73_03615 [Rickettsiales bacterium]|jgi:hypothetical protein|nr:hypothetical protein [Rickettsiales bacterium]
MTDHISEISIANLAAENDRKNNQAIRRALADGLINDEAARYLDAMYADSMGRFREVFHVLGKCFGAPKAAVMPYDYGKCAAVDTPMKISDINPMSPYIVHHRLDADTMRNQFFATDGSHKIDLLVSSIVSVVVGAQKSMKRSLEKITGKYYRGYVDEVAATAERVISDSGREASGRAIAQKIQELFSKKYITNASETVLAIIGRGHEKIAVELVRELDKITKPYLRLNDVWRVKCLFDLVPQVRTFTERMYEMAPERVIQIRDSFYEFDHPRNYRDAKVILNIGTNGTVIPMEIICQVRTFFEYETATHAQYEKTRKSGASAGKEEIEKKLATYSESGIREYNMMICECVDELFERVGWNILYSQRGGESMFDGFPKIAKQYYPAKIVEAIINKVDSAVENEVFHVPNAPAKLTPVQELEIFRWMTRFILVSAVPYSNGNWEINCPGVPGKFFNFVMNELHRYYKK